MSFIFNTWNGKEKLWRVWVLGYPLAWLVLAPIIVLTQEANIDITVAFIAGALLYFWLLVSIWRCSNNSNTKFWALANKILVVLTVVSVIAVIIIKGL
ncbi:MAG: hypothetical protein H8E21_15000 [Gammaproteobacteria bacterium]|nr:hypothetical protein [Gammaproteobacteria bacterium]MBL6998490.1 hypothetical protein [Gammaproteobacteria bacterium]